jgi:starvation-inducible DNA-binding protein
MNYLGIDAKQLSSVSRHLNRLLTSYNIYYQNLRNFHWHVRGKSFFDLHGLFEEYYNEAKEQIDDIAERILTIGHKPDTSLQTYLDKAEIHESSDLLRDGEMARHILYNQGELIKIMRASIKEAASVEDEGTVDVISGMLSKMEKNAWLLHSWAEKRRVSQAELAM